jgi:thymidylate kinase
MPSVALIGPDGAGKTTVTRMLERSTTLRLKYLYMGINMSSSNVALPTSRLAEYLKTRMDTRASASPPSDPQHAGPAPTRRRRGIVWTTLRLVNRLAEQWFRQFVAWSYQLRGYVVLYDRHFVLDFGGRLPGQVLSTDQRIYRWCLAHLYPRPDMVIMLDAPGEVLFARKGEWTVADLENRRQLLLQLGTRLPAFLIVDATRPLDVVYEEVARHIVAFCDDPSGYGAGRGARATASVSSRARRVEGTLDTSPSRGVIDA